MIIGIIMLIMAIAFFIYVMCACASISSREDEWYEEVFGNERIDRKN
jgi:hypothetical protein